jgi:hypothetical protein
MQAAAAARPGVVENKRLPSSVMAKFGVVRARSRWGVRQVCATTVGVLLVSALAGCGSTETLSAPEVAVSYLRDLVRGDGAAACGLESSGTLSSQTLALTAQSRFTLETPFSCQATINLRPQSVNAAEAMGIPILWSTSQPSRVIAEGVRAEDSVVRGDSATVLVTDRRPYADWFKNASPFVTLIRQKGRWRITMPVPSPQAIIEEWAPAPSCLRVWNRAVRAGAVRLPPFRAYSEILVWAELTGATASSCGMLLQTPILRYSMVEKRGGGWSRPVESAILSNPGRSVWLDRRGVATPASHMSPDGVEPALRQ